MLGASIELGKINISKKDTDWEKMARLHNIVNILKGEPARVRVPEPIKVDGIFTEGQKIIIQREAIEDVCSRKVTP